MSEKDSAHFPPFVLKVRKTNSDNWCIYQKEAISVKQILEDDNALRNSISKFQRKRKRTSSHSCDSVQHGGKLQLKDIPATRSNSLDNMDCLERVVEGIKIERNDEESTVPNNENMAPSPTCESFQEASRSRSQSSTTSLSNSDKPNSLTDGVEVGNEPSIAAKKGSKLNGKYTCQACSSLPLTIAAFIKHVKEMHFFPSSRTVTSSSTSNDEARQNCSHSLQDDVTLTSGAQHQSSMSTSSPNVSATNSSNLNDSKDIKTRFSKLDNIVSNLKEHTGMVAKISPNKSDLDTNEASAVTENSAPYAGEHIVEIRESETDNTSSATDDIQSLHAGHCSGQKTSQNAFINSSNFSCKATETPENSQKLPINANLNRKEPFVKTVPPDIPPPNSVLQSKTVCGQRRPSNEAINFQHNQFNVNRSPMESECRKHIHNPPMPMNNSARFPNVPLNTYRSFPCPQVRPISPLYAQQIPTNPGCMHPQNVLKTNMDHVRSMPLNSNHSEIFCHPQGLLRRTDGFCQNGFLPGRDMGFATGPFKQFPSPQIPMNSRFSITPPLPYSVPMNMDQCNHSSNSQGPKRTSNDNISNPSSHVSCRSSYNSERFQDLQSLVASGSVTMPDTRILQTISCDKETWSNIQDTLHEAFAVFPYLTEAECMDLASKTGLLVKQIKILFVVARLQHGISWEPEEIEHARKHLKEAAKNKHHLSPKVGQDQMNQTPAAPQNDDTHTSVADLTPEQCDILKWSYTTIPLTTQELERLEKLTKAPKLTILQYFKQFQEEVMPNPNILSEPGKSNGSKTGIDFEPSAMNNMQQRKAVTQLADNITKYFSVMNILKTPDTINGNNFSDLNEQDGK